MVLFGTYYLAYDVVFSDGARNINYLTSRITRCGFFLDEYNRTKGHFTSYTHIYPCSKMTCNKMHLIHLLYTESKD